LLLRGTKRPGPSNLRNVSQGTHENEKKGGQKYITFGPDPQVISGLFSENPPFYGLVYPNSFGRIGISARNLKPACGVPNGSGKDFS